MNHPANESKFGVHEDFSYSFACKFQPNIGFRMYQSPKPKTFFLS